MKEAKTLKNIKYQLGYSNFSFELWMILHKKDCFGPLNNRKQYLSQIQQCFREKLEDLDHYKKEAAFRRCLGQLTLDNVRAAIRRAKRLAEQNERDHKTLIRYSGYSYYRDNPALSINEVVERILTE